jgi:hypothetical protein
VVRGCLVEHSKDVLPARADAGSLGAHHLSDTADHHVPDGGRPGGGRETAHVLCTAEWENKHSSPLGVAARKPFSKAHSGLFIYPLPLSPIPILSLAQCPELNCHPEITKQSQGQKVTMWITEPKDGNSLGLQ